MHGAVQYGTNRVPNAPYLLVEQIFVPQIFNPVFDDITNFFSVGDVDRLFKNNRSTLGVFFRSVVEAYASGSPGAGLLVIA